MRKLISLIFLLSLSLSPSSIRAELLLSSGNVDTQKLHKIKSLIQSYGKINSSAFRERYHDIHIFTNDEGFGSSNFVWVFNGKEYLSSIAAFVPDASLTEGNLPRLANPYFRYQCHFFLFDAMTSELLGVVPLAIKPSKDLIFDRPFCGNVLGISVAKVIPDSLLVVLGYGDSVNPPDLRKETPEFSSTLLLRWSGAGATLKIEQDDSCLGNPNKYATIASARKALKRCSEKQ